MNRNYLDAGAMMCRTAEEIEVLRAISQYPPGWQGIFSSWLHTDKRRKECQNMTNAEAMEQIIEALHAAAKALDEAANQLAGQKKPQKTAAPAVNKAEKTLTLEEVRKVAADKARQGHTEEVRQSFRNSVPISFPVWMRPNIRP